MWTLGLSWTIPDLDEWPSAFPRHQNRLEGTNKCQCIATSLSPHWLALNCPQVVLIHDQGWAQQLPKGICPSIPRAGRNFPQPWPNASEDLAPTQTWLSVWEYQRNRPLEGEPEPQSPDSTWPSSPSGKPSLSTCLYLSSTSGNHFYHWWNLPGGVLSSSKWNGNIGEHGIHSSLFKFSKKYTLLNVRCSLATGTWARGKSLSPKWLDSP
jgi:hypothetical protein